MTEPTLTELRELCEMMLGNIEHGDRIGTQDIAAVSHAFLSLTDQTPLTADHCREAGMIEDSQQCFTEGRITVDCFDDDYRTLIQSKPTVGQLRLALLQENSDGE